MKDKWLNQLVMLQCIYIRGDQFTDHKLEQVNLSRNVIAYMCHMLDSKKKNSIPTEATHQS